MIARSAALLIAGLSALLAGQPAMALNNNYSPALSDAQVAYYLNNPKLATAARYGVKDSAGNSMDVPTIIQMTGQPYKYAAVYHTGTCVANCSSASPTMRFRLNLAGSNDLINWTFVRQLIDNADMPRMVQVTGASWILLAHEQWQGPGPGSTLPSAVTFELFYDFNDLMNGTIRSTWSMPIYNSPYSINGTPSIYEAHLAYYNGYYSVDGQYGFHINQSATSPTDVNGVTTIYKLFDPTGATVGYPSTATNYNNLMIANGAVDAIGGRDTLLTTTARFNLQEGHTGRPGTDWDKWRVWLYKFAETTNYPTGAGTATQLNPQTPGGSTSFANPSIAVVDRPGGGGKALVVSYFLFSAAPGEGGSLIYYFNI
jgi:hypothetical protein